MKRNYRIIVYLLLCCLVALPGCSLAETSGTVAGSYKNRHTEDTWDDASAVHITFVDDGVTLAGTGANAVGTQVTISKAGTYVLTGACSDGQLRVNVSKDDRVVLVFNGLDLACQTSAPVWVQSADEVRIILAPDSINRLTDAVQYVYEEGADEPDAALFSKDDLSFTGSGTLYVTGQMRNGIATKNDLVITDGHFIIEAVNDALRGKDSVSISGGEFTITAGNDGIKANEDAEADKGWIGIDGGVFSITSGCDAIQAETWLTITGGSFTITTGGGSAAAPVRVDSFGGGGRWGAASTDTTATETESVKGIKAAALTIHGGSFIMDTEDDALHANGDATITGGSFVIQTGDDGVHADGALNVTGGSINIMASYEGLEGATVLIEGGDIQIVASDDGINAAGGSDGEAGMWGRDFFRGGGGGNSDYWITITGGNVWVNAQGDGLDSNGNMTLQGGTVIVHGPSSGGNSALDCDGSMTISGGNILALGSATIDQFASPSVSQALINVSYGSLPAETAVTLTDASGKVVATVMTEKQTASILFSAPELVIGQSYTIETSTGVVTEVTLSSTTLSVSAGGGTTGGGMGNPGRMTNPGGSNNWRP